MAMRRAVNRDRNFPARSGRDDRSVSDIYFTVEPGRGERNTLRPGIQIEEDQTIPSGRQATRTRSPTPGLS